jgi:hypothetical protein
LGDPNGLNGTSGAALGEALYTQTTTLPRVRSSVFAGAFVLPDCEGTVSASGANVDTDNSCSGFSGNVNYAGNFFGPELDLEGGRAVIRPRSGSPVIDAASDCLDLDGVAVTADQSGRERPLDGNADTTAQCDIGAIEFSFTIFADGFEF